MKEEGALMLDLLLKRIVWIATRWVQAMIVSKIDFQSKLKDK